MLTCLWWIMICAKGWHVSGLERKISMRTSKEELIQRGILMPGEAAQASPFLSSSVLLEAASRSSTPRLNLPQLAASSHSTGRSTSSVLSVLLFSVLCWNLVRRQTLIMRRRVLTAHTMAGALETQTTGSLISLRLPAATAPVQSFPGQSHNCYYQLFNCYIWGLGDWVLQSVSYLQILSYAKHKVLDTFYFTVCNLRTETMQPCPRTITISLSVSLSQINCKNTKLNSATYLQQANCWG